MKRLKNILNKINGLAYPQEYLCIDGSLKQPLYVYLIDKGRTIRDISTDHAFVGYSPLIIGLPWAVVISIQSLQLRLAFTPQPIPLNAVFNQKDAVALLVLEKIKEQPANHPTVVYYEGISGQHRFVSAFHRLIIHLNNRLYHRKPGNVYLSDNLLEQVQIAYSVPRNISLITTGKSSCFNLFPTDLHGPIGEAYYIISLRHDGRACTQVMDTMRIVLTQVSSDFYRQAYALGKNHMQEFRVREHFPFGIVLSAQIQLPLPQSAISYRELELIDSFTHGIHRLMLFKILSGKRVSNGLPPLAHIHTVYATWRRNNQLPGNYLLR